MRRDLTDITVVLDRSGSMASCQQQAQDGLNEFVTGQKANRATFMKDGILRYAEATFSLVQFDNVIEQVHTALPIAQVPKLFLHPRNNTALLDAVGLTIVKTGDRLRAMREQDRPGLVIFVIVTDGIENASREFTQERVRQMVEHQQQVYNWQFTFLGANIDAFAVGQQCGFLPKAIAEYEVKTAGAMFANVGNCVTRMCAASAQGQTITDSLWYNDQERREMKPEEINNVKVTSSSHT